MSMDAALRWPRSTPWRRAWPAATLAFVLHLALLHGWTGSAHGLQQADRLVSTIQVRLLESRPAPEAALPTPPALSPVTDSGLRPARSEDRPDKAPARPTPGLAAKAAPAETVASAAVASAPVPGLRPAPDYLLAGRLDPGPKLLDEVDPVYPVEAGLREGTVVLRLLIGKTGAVDEVAVVRSAPADLFDRSALAAFAQARFSPGMLLGLPVKSQLTIEVHFTPVDRGGNVAAPTY
jgi:TonB family protein